MNKIDFGVLIENNAFFALDLYNQLRLEDGNLFFSPYSVSVALAMTYAGARGETESQMARVMRFDLPQNDLHPAFASLQKIIADAEAKGNIQLKVANSLWPQTGYPFLETYLNLVKAHYGVSITALDYVNNAEATRQIINNWVEGQTEKKIRELIAKGKLDALTRLVLTNAIYFKGDWATQFDVKMTEDDDFWSPQSKVKVPMMTRQGVYRYTETDDLQILELPYKGNTLSMLVLLPHDKDGLPRIENQLTPASLSKATTRMFEQDVIVHLPKFKVESAFTLNDVLVTLGMSDAFNDKADFSGMDGSKWLSIGFVLHKAFIDVNEEGTEAAAATVVIMRSKGISSPAEFRADHPFLFLIRENQTGSILFMGKVVKP